MAAMGHRIAAHNFAHRDLGKLNKLEEIEYEVEQARDAVSDLTGTGCDDFAFAFGQPDNLTQAAAEFLKERCRRVYSCVRGLNVPGRTPAFLLRGAIVLEYPLAFTKLCLDGGADHLMGGRHRQLADYGGLLPSEPARIGAKAEAAPGP
jgi:peptidoglycan/xylan/chitin deacetylase (PgdA/CDA1 family)